MEYTDPVTNEKYIPYVIEPSLGVERLFLAMLTNAYDEEEVGEGDTRVVLRFKPSLAPYKVAIMPLLKKDILTEKADALYADMRKRYSTTYDVTGSIGKRYRRQDEIGTPFCITIDFDTLEDEAVTVRERDSMKQERIKIAELRKYLDEKLEM